MCGKVRFVKDYQQVQEVNRQIGQIASIGEILPMVSMDETGPFTFQSVWGGHARIETLPRKWPHSIISVLPGVMEYAEQETYFGLPVPGAIVFVTLEEDTHYYFKGASLCVTREAITEEEALVHHRHPYILSQDILNEPEAWEALVDKLMGGKGIYCSSV